MFESEDSKTENEEINEPNMLKGWSRSQGAAGPEVGQDDGHPAGCDQSGTPISRVWPYPDPTP